MVGARVGAGFAIVLIADTGSDRVPAPVALTGTHPDRAGRRRGIQVPVSSQKNFETLTANLAFLTVK